VSLPYGLLGLLAYQDSTGYELTKVFEDSLNHFWHAQSSQIYRELDRLEQKGWVVSQNVVQDKRPNKRVYAITAAGRSALADWLKNSAVEFEHCHEPLLVRVFFGANDPEVTLKLLKDCRDLCLATIEEQSRKIQEKIATYSDLIQDGETKRLYWEMTLDYGMSQARATAAWAERCIDKIEGRIK
jgi:DNA-binding PadR family transcriptional regulator